jgi:hypothetical protein
MRVLPAVFLLSDAGRCPAVVRRLVSIVSAADTSSHAVPAMQEEAAALIAGLVFAGE